MNTRFRISSGVLLVVSASTWLAVAQAAEPATKSGKPTFNIHSAQVQESIRAAARTQTETSPPSSTAKTADAVHAVSLGGQTTIPFRAPLRPHHVKCDNIDCVAYSADDVALYSVPRAQYYAEPMDGSRRSDAWLACQSRDNLLSTFERYDKCRGITIGLPLSFGDTTIAAPGLRF